MAEAAAERIVGHGMVAIGLDHFARPGDDLAVAQAEGRLRRNFQGYTSDDAPALIGMGASAIGSLPQGYVQNAHEVKDWRLSIEAGVLPVVRGFALGDEDRLRRAVIERLMCDLAVDLEEMCRAHNRDPGHLDDALAALRPMVADGLVRIDGRRLSVPESARPWVRIPSSAFDQYLAPEDEDGQRHARAV
jgi:oxygen-independent coproporphyrinogen-3 oxidase